MSMFFKGPTIFSNFPAKVGDWTGEKYRLATFAAPTIVLANADHSAYSATNSYHKRHVRRILKQFPVKRFDVPSEVMFATPVEILPALIERHMHAMNRATASRGRLSIYMRHMDECAKQANDYAEHYSLPAPALHSFKNPKQENRLRYRMAKAMVLENKMRAERGW
jgi:hypothetical protein